MKSFSRYLVPAAGLLAALPAARADDPHDTEKKEMRVVVEGNGPSPHNRRFMHEAGPQEMESVTFLGVETHPADATLAEQLNLARGTGLVVRMIAPESPAAAALRKNDILVKLDDQLLIEQRQLAVLIRNHREGDDVTITYIRGGKEGTARVKLAKHEVPKMALMDEPFFHARNLPFFEEGSLPGMDREDMDRVLSLMDQGGPGPTKRVHIERTPQPGMRNTTVNTSNSNMVFSDDKGSLDLTIKDGKKTLVAKDAKGEPIFSGPVTTPEERKALPPEVRSRLDQLEGMQEFSFQTDDDFQGGHMRVVKPGKTKIAVPPQVPATPVPSGSAPF